MLKLYAWIKIKKKITKKSKKINWKAFKLESSTEQYSLKDLLAIQVLRKYVEDFHANYLSYEINLVLHDHKRINIIDHGDEEAIEMQVKKISEFLKLPVWKSY